MNSCAYYQELISTLVDGELSDEESEALMLHLNSCSRCNAMYAVFHDLSDILSEEPEPLPEGLHENIMAGVRRSELMKKNRRMRRIGLRTAMTAAACAVLVLFAAAGFGPGRHGDSVTVRSAEEAQKLMQTPAPAAESPAADIYAAPAMTPAPVWTQPPAPVQTAAPAQADAYYTTGSSTTYTPVQPEQPDYYTDSYYFEETNPAPVQPAAPAWTPAPVQPAAPAWTPEPVYTPSAVTPAEPVQTTAPVQVAASAQTPTPVQTSTAVLNHQNALAGQNTVTAVPDVIEPAPVAETPDIEVSLIQAPAAVQDSPAPSLPAADETAVTAENEQESERDMEQETEESPGVFSFFSSRINRFDTAPAEQLAESKLAAAPAVIDAPIDDLPSDDPEETPDPILNSIPLEIPEDKGAMEIQLTAEPAAASVSEERVSVYGSEARSRLLAMIGSQEDSLPQEAELTRLVHVSLVPDDAYGSEEAMDISIYGDFVYCSLHPVEGGSVTYRADCSLKELDSFLADCMAAPAPSAAPTPDPYFEEAPAQTTETSPTETPAPTETPLPTADEQEDAPEE